MVERFLETKARIVTQPYFFHAFELQRAAP